MTRDEQRSFVLSRWWVELIGIMDGWDQAGLTGMHNSLHHLSLHYWRFSRSFYRRARNSFGVLIFLVALFPPVAIAQTHSTILWLGDITSNEQASWNAQGFDVKPLSCGYADADCVRDALTSSLPTYLVARADHTPLVRALYTDGITQDRLRGIVMLRAKADYLSKIKANKNSPNLLVFVEQSDTRSVVVSARLLTSTLRMQGVSSFIVFTGKGGVDDTPLPSMTLDIMAYFAGHPPFKKGFQTVLDITAKWQDPPLDHQAFWRKPELLTVESVDQDLLSLMRVHYSFESHLMKQWYFDTYTAFDLLSYRDTVKPEARYISLGNKRNQIYYLDLETYAPYEPVIVTGIDDETNLYRFAWFYKTKAMYTWKPDIQNTSVRLLGPFLHFRKPVPEELQIPLLLRSALTFEGITFSTEDPLKPIRAYTDNIQKIITSDNKCVYCHQIGEVGGQYHHVDAQTTELQGGIALPLTDYPDYVMHAFLYDQENTAKKIGMTPNPIETGYRRRVSCLVSGFGCGDTL